METKLKGTLNLKTVSLAGRPEGGFKGTSQATLTVWPILQRSCCFPAKQYFSKVDQFVGQPAPAPRVFQVRQRNAINYPVVLNMGPGHRDIAGRINGLKDTKLYTSAIGFGSACLLAFFRLRHQAPPPPQAAAIDASSMVPGSGTAES